MMRSYKFQIRPTTRQAQSLAACIEDHRQLYNAALEERREAYRMRRVSISYGSQSAQLKEIRNTDRRRAGALVVWFPTGHPAAAGQVVRRVLPPGQGAPDARVPEVQGPRMVRHCPMAERPRRVPVGFSTEPARGPRLPAGHRARQGQPASACAGRREDDLGEAGGSPVVRHPVL